jgi:anti-anti-sigma factor
MSASMNEPLSVEIIDDANGRAELLVSGQLDLASRSTLESTLRRLLADSDAETITLNLAELTFCDGAGLHAFAAAQREAAAHRKTLVLANVCPAVLVVFDTVQFGRVVPIQTSGDADSQP